MLSIPKKIIGRKQVVGLLHEQYTITQLLFLTKWMFSDNRVTSKRFADPITVLCADPELILLTGRKVTNFERGSSNEAADGFPLTGSAIFLLHDVVVDFSCFGCFPGESA